MSYETLLFLYMKNYGYRYHQDFTKDSTIAKILMISPKALLLLVVLCIYNCNAAAQTSEKLLNQVFTPDFVVEALKVANDSPSSVFRTPIRGMPLYDNNAKLFGQIIVGHSGLKARGLISVEGSLMRCNQAAFTEKVIDCPNGKFIVKSSNPSKPVLEVNDVHIQYLLDEQMALVIPQKDEETIIFPNHHYELTFHEFRWPFNQQNIHIESTLDSLGNPFPIHVKSTSIEHAGLAFDGKSFDYVFEDDKIIMGGVDEIVLSHIIAMPAGGKVVIEPDGTLDTLKNAKVRFNTDQKHMKAISEGDIAIDSKNHFSGVGTYEFVNYKGQHYLMEIQDITMKTFSTSNDNHVEEMHEAAVAAIVPDNEPMELIPGMLFTGKLKLASHKRDFDFDGRIAINLPELKDNWFPYSGTGGNGFKVSDGMTTNSGRVFENGIYLDNAGKLYNVFMKKNTLPTSFQLLKASGELRYNPDRVAYTLTDHGAANTQYKKQLFTYNPKSLDSDFAGLLNLNEDSKNITVKSSGIGRLGIGNQSMSLNAIIELEFKTNRKAFETIAASFQGLEPIVTTSTAKNTYENLEHFIPSQDLQMFKSTPPNELNLISFFVNSMVFTNVQLEWSKQHQAFYSKGKFGISSFFKSNVNAQVNGFVYIPLGKNRQEMHIYMIGTDHWYYLKRDGDMFYMRSSNEVINEYYANKDSRISSLSEEEKDSMVEFFKKNFGQGK